MPTCGGAKCLLLSLSTIADAKISNPPWVNFQSAGWVSFQSAPTLGFLSRQGKLIYHTTTDTVTTQVVIEAFDRLLEQKSPQAFAIVVLDNASIHRSALFQRKELEWRAQRLYVIFLPAYSPELNLIEILWRKIKYEWLPVTAYQSFQSLTDHVLKVLSG